MRETTKQVEVTLGDNGVARVVLQRPAKLNALSRALIGDLAEAFSRLSGEAGLRCVILAGAGRAFSAGADTADLETLDPDSAEAFIRSLHGAFRTVRDCPVPVIARIDGPCLGGGLELAASCDMRAASESSVFAMPEVQLGIPSVIEAALLPRLAGWGRASELLLTGQMVDADQALTAGLVERVAPAEELDNEVAVWVDAILAAEPGAVRAQKALMRRWERLPLDEAVEAGIAAFREAYRGPEPRMRLQDRAAWRRASGHRT